MDILSRYNNLVRSSYQLSSITALMRELSSDDEGVAPYIGITSNESISGSAIVFEPINCRDDLIEAEQAGACTLEDTAEEGTCQLWSCGAAQFVVLCDNTVITRYDDQQDGDPVFSI